MSIMSWIFFTTVLIYSVMIACSYSKPINTTWTEPNTEHDSADEKSSNYTIQTGSTTSNCSNTTKHPLETDSKNYFTGNLSTAFLDSLKVTEHLPTEAICARQNNLTDDVVIEKLPGPFFLPFPQVFASLYVFAFFVIYFYFTWLACRSEKKINGDVPNVTLNIYSVS